MTKIRVYIAALFMMLSMTLMGSIGNVIFNEPTNLRGLKISDAMFLLGHHSGVNFIVEDSIKDKIIDNSFVGGETLEDIVNIIAITNGMRIKPVGGNSYLLEPKTQGGTTGTAQSVTGVIKTKNFGIGIDGARVTLLNSGLQPVSTSYGGKFIIHNVHPGTYIMKVEKAGYETEGEFVTLGNDSKTVNINMYRSGEKIDVATQQTSKSKILGSFEGSGGVRKVTEQVNLLNIGADDAKNILLSLMEDQFRNSGAIMEEIQTDSPSEKITITKREPVINTTMGAFRAIPVAKQNMLILSGTPDQIAIAKNLLQILDKKSKQVRIAAQVIEVTDNLFENLGFSWAYSSGSLKPTEINNPNYPTNIIPLPGAGNSNAANNANGVVKGNGTVYPLVLNFFRFMNGGNDFLDFSINMLQSTQDAVVSAIPSILVANGETGKFKVTDESVVSYSSSINSLGIESFTATLGEAGVILEVVPVIRDDNTIQLKIKIEVSKFLADGSLASPSDGFANPKSQRVIETIVNVNNGDTIFIGGMKQASVNNGKTKVPFLGDMPLLGTAFRNNEVASRVNDLYVKLKIDIANHENVKHSTDVRGFMLPEIHNLNDQHEMQLDTSIYPQFR